MRPLCLLLLLSLARPAAAQDPDTTYADRAFRRLTARLAADTTLPAGVRTRIGNEQLAHLEPGLFARLDDTTAVALMRAFSVTLGLLPDSVCGGFLGGGAGRGDAGYLNAAAAMDSTVVDRWMAVFEQALRAQADAGGVRRAATEAESQAIVIGIIGRLGSEDRQRMMAAFGSGVPTDQCWAARTLFAGIAELPATEAGPLVRSMFHEQPKTVGPKPRPAKP